MTLLLWATSAFALPGVTQRINLSSKGEEGVTDPSNPNPNCGLPVKISADGRFVLFRSEAGNLVPDDSNHGVGTTDVFVRNRVTNTTELVSVNNDGEQANGPSGPDGISSDGRYVLFWSGGSNLVPGDTIDVPDLFVRDRLLGLTERVNLSSSGEPGNHFPSLAAISADGRYVTFSSEATDLVAGDTNGCYDVFVRDRTAGTTERVSVSTTGRQANGDSFTDSISADGRYVAFHSDASNLVPDGHGGIFVRDRAEGTTEYIGGSSDTCFLHEISPDGSCVLWDSEDEDRVYLHDRLQDITQEMTVSSEGQPGVREGDLSDCWAGIGGLSSDGRYVSFHTNLAGLASGDADGQVNVFLRDRVAGTTELVSIDRSGSCVAGSQSSMSADGRCITFISDSSVLVPGDTNGQNDVFVRDLDARFHDVASCFWAFAEIEACVAAQIVYGYLDSFYRPEYAVTRDQMAVYVSRALAGGEEGVPEFTGDPTFPDVGTEDWALDHVEYAVAQNVVAGYDDGLYHPEYEVTRDQMAVYVARALVAPSGEAALADYVPAEPRNFPDVASDFWSYKHVEYCVENGVVAGYLDGLYHPEIVVTRDQMAVYVARAFGLTG
jgi:Tol biopolymer transport system component